MNTALMKKQTDLEFDTRAFRDALGNFATGVTVITASDGERRVGVTVNSFNSVSLDPPLVLWSIGKKSGSFEVFKQAGFFGINILAADQIAISNRFARGTSDDKYDGVKVHEGAGGCLLLPDASANLQCQTHEVLDGGDHWIFIGRVLALHSSGRSPLLYHKGAYSTVSPHPDVETSK
ncbi:flavin reductase family protein [Pseudomonas plecoglossicida]|uniref:flavin reductase family protein n=1 Tax=Pseudomonas plecoglossicida TaxID=70775 RepID=UPI002E0F17A5